MPAISRSLTSTLLQYYIQSDKYNNRDEMWQKDGEFVDDVLLHCQIVKDVWFIMCSEWSGNCLMVLELLVSCTKVQETKQVQETKDSFMHGKLPCKFSLLWLTILIGPLFSFFFWIFYLLCGHATQKHLTFVELTKFLLKYTFSDLQNKNYYNFNLCSSN